MNPRLRVIAGPLKDTVIDLPAGEISIGRVGTNQVAISDPALSRRHCLIAQDDGRFRIEDLQSRNGTLVNGAAITSIGSATAIASAWAIRFCCSSPRRRAPNRRSVEFDDENLPMQATVHLRPEDAVYLHPQVSAEEDSVSAALSRNLNALLKVSQSVHLHPRPARTAEQVLQSIFEVAPPKMAPSSFDRHGEFTSTLARDRQGSEAPVRVSRTIVQQVMKQGVSCCSTMCSTRASTAESRVSSPPRSARSYAFR